MSNIKNAFEDMLIIRDEMNYRREELAEFIADNEYTRGGSYPKKIAALKEGLASSMIRLHVALLTLNGTRVPVRRVRISRKRYAYHAQTMRNQVGIGVYYKIKEIIGVDGTTVIGRISVPKYK